MATKSMEPQGEGEPLQVRHLSIQFGGACLLAPSRKGIAIESC